MSKSPFNESTLKQIKLLAAQYIGTDGLPHAVAAVLINRELNLKRKFKAELKKNALAGMCHRGNITSAVRVSENGKKLLASIHMVLEKEGIVTNKLSSQETKAAHNKKGFGNKRRHNGRENRVINARLRQMITGDVTVCKEEEIRETENRYKESPGFISARERRKRGLTEREVGGHMPEPSPDLSAEDILFLERRLYAN